MLRSKDEKIEMLDLLLIQDILNDRHVIWLECHILSDENNNTCELWAGMLVNGEGDISLSQLRAK